MKIEGVSITIDGVCVEIQTFQTWSRVREALDHAFRAVATTPTFFNEIAEDVKIIADNSLPRSTFAVRTKSWFAENALWKANAGLTTEELADAMVAMGWVSGSPTEAKRNHAVRVALYQLPDTFRKEGNKWFLSQWLNNDEETK